MMKQPGEINMLLVIGSIRILQLQPFGYDHAERFEIDQ